GPSRRTMRALQRPLMAPCLCVLVVAGAVAAGCRGAPAVPEPSALDRSAALYIELVAALANRDPDSASADTAMPATTPAVPTPPLTLLEIAAKARTAAEGLRIAAVRPDEQ